MYICIYRACERSMCVCVKSSLTYVYERSVYVNKTRSLCLYKYICTYRERMRVCAGATFSQSLCLSLSEKHTYTHTQPPPIYFIQIFISSYTHTYAFCCLPPLWGGKGEEHPPRHPGGSAPAGLGGFTQGGCRTRSRPRRRARERCAAWPLSHPHPPTYICLRSIFKKYIPMCL